MDLGSRDECGTWTVALNWIFSEFDDFVMSFPLMVLILVNEKNINERQIFLFLRIINVVIVIAAIIPPDIVAIPRGVSMKPFFLVTVK